MSSSHVLIPLIASIVFLFPLVIVLLHRPWRAQHTLFLLYLIPAMLWSLCDFILRRNYFPENQELLVKIIVCLAIWMLTQLHYILRYYGTGKIQKIPFVYLPLAATIALTISNNIPQRVEVSYNATKVEYGVWILPVALSILIFIGHDIYLLLRKWRTSTQLTERNQLTYLIAATIVGGPLLITTLIPFGTTYATAHMANLAVALIFVYAIAAHRLVDVGVALRRVLVYFWLTTITVLVYSVLFWLASKAFHFEFKPIEVVSGIIITFACTILVYRLYSLFRQAIEGIFIGKKYNYRQHLLEFISGTPTIANLEAFGNRMLSLLSQSTDSERAWLLLPSIGNACFETRSSYTLDNTDATPLRVRQDSPLSTWLKREASPLSRRELSILPEFASLWEEERKEFDSARVETFFPIINDGRLVAIIALGKKRSGGAHSLEEIELITSVANRISANIEKEFLREQLQAKEEELTVFNRLMTIMTSSINIRDAFDRFSQELKKVLPVDWATIALADGDELHFLALSSNTPTPWKAEERIPLSGTGTEWVMKEQRNTYEPDLAKQKRFSTGEKHLKQGIRSIIYAPLISAGKSIGSLTIASRYPQAYNANQINLLEELASQITAPIENSQLYYQAREKARIDELTGLFNRRHFEERLKEEITRHARYGGTFSVLMLDLDSFKIYNDIFGHPAGDDLLRQVGVLIKNSIRTSDQAFRYGGDEFVVLLPHIDTDSAYHAAERIRQDIARHMQLSSTGVTASIGVANCPDNGVTPADLVNVADTALYYAKYNGGNRTYLPTKVLSTPMPEISRETRSPSLAAIYALTTAVDAKDHYTYTHSHKVRAYAIALAEAIGSAPDVISRLSAASLLHDIGKIGVPDHVLTSKEPLTREELEQIKAHPRLGVTIIANVPGLAPCVPAILYHHENYDGSGYPEGLKGESIPLEARILAIANAFADMTSDRPYRTALSREQAMAELKRHAGTQFDPKLAQAFINAAESGAIAEWAAETK